MTFSDYQTLTRNEPVYVILGVQGSGTNLLARIMNRVFGFSVVRDRALVFNAGTNNWSLGLGEGDGGLYEPDSTMQQATTNIIADMGVQPATLQPGLVAATASTDTTAPVTTILSPAAGATVVFKSLGQAVEDACAARLVYDAAIAERREVRVIHGFGQGKLRSAVAGFLEGHPHVAAFRLGEGREGGAGATIVELKS